MTRAVRERVWAVLEKWQVGSRNDGAIMIWPDPGRPGGQSILVLGEPPIELCETSSIVLARTELSEAALRSLTIEIDGPPF
jgi:CRISPR-associated protein Cas2